MSERYVWLLYVGLAGLSWGTYVPVIYYGGNELGKLANARLMAILCVGIAYFVIGVAFPLAMFFSGQFKWPELKPTGLLFSGLAGVAGAVGALCVVFATSSAVAAADQAGLPRDSYKLYIAPLIFGLAPIINTLVSIVWHPQPGEPFHFGFTMPGWKLWLGIILVGVGAGLVLFSKEEAETGKAKAHANPNPQVAQAQTPLPEAPR